MVGCFQHKQLLKCTHVLSLRIFRQDVAMSQAQLNSLSTAADDVSAALYLTKCRSFCKVLLKWQLCRKMTVIFFTK